ncbi:Hepatitis A virus cellular receptor 1 like protein, partial [Chelonia mydas]
LYPSPVSITVVSLSAGLTVSGSPVRGVVGQNVTLPCKYRVNHPSDITTMCWGRGSCPSFQCSQPILWTDGRSFQCSQPILWTDGWRVTERQSSRYQLEGNLTRGDVSLTIVNVAEADGGVYCCRVEIPGWFNDQRKNLEVAIETGLTVSGSPVRGVVGQNVTLPCKYRVNHPSDITTMCWGRGSCPSFQCSQPILWTDGWSVTKRQSSRYQLEGNLTRGDVSLTIVNVAEADGGVYCCRVEIPGWFNDQQKNLEVAIETAHGVSLTVVRAKVGQSVKLPCTYSVRQMSDISVMCWGRGICPSSKCSSEIVRTDGWKVISTASGRYQLKGPISRGDVSLTISNVDHKDRGAYCCRIEIPGWFNDIKQNLNLQVYRDLSAEPEKILSGVEEEYTLLTLQQIPDSHSISQGTCHDPVESSI